MKISYSEFPVLEKLQNGMLSVLDIPSYQGMKIQPQQVIILEKALMHNTQYFLKEINVISEPFKDAAIEAFDKLTEIYDDIVKVQKLDFKVEGTFIEAGLTYFCRLEQKNRTIKSSLSSIYWYNGDTLFGCVYMDDHVAPIIWLSFEYMEWLKKTNTKFDGVIRRFMVYSLFKNYAPVETLILPPNTHVNTVTCKYVNDTKLPITYLDSKWFTNLVKSDAFTVHGHFRLQACGTGLKDHKLIWIDEYEKSGYIAPTRILKNKG